METREILADFKLIGTMQKSRKITVTLPPNHIGGPIAVIGKGEPMEVYGDGRLIVSLRGFECAVFEIRKPKWWQFWKKTQWAVR